MKCSGLRREAKAIRKQLPLFLLLQSKFGPLVKANRKLYRFRLSVCGKQNTLQSSKEMKKAGSRETRQCGILITRVEDQHREQTGEGRMSETDTTRKKDEKFPFSECMERRPRESLWLHPAFPYRHFPELRKGRPAGQYEV